MRPCPVTVVLPYNTPTSFRLKDLFPARDTTKGSAFGGSGVWRLCMQGSMEGSEEEDRWA